MRSTAREAGEQCSGVHQEEERRLRESREYHERSQREDAEKIQRLLRDAEQLSVVYIPPPQSDV